MKITILGAGNSGCMTLLFFSYHNKYLDIPFELELIYDKNVDPTPVGQGTNLIVTDLVWKTLGLNVLDENSFSFTIKHGILYENWSKKRKSFFHPFPLGGYAYHQNPAEFQKFVLETIKDVSIKDTGLKNYNDIDSDFIIDCTGAPKDLKNYDLMINPLNHVLLSSLPYEDYTYTKTTATPDGWCFQIPLKDKVSLGYNFNSEITSIQQAEKNFKDIFNVKKINQHFEFKQYLSKTPISEDNRIALNGNKLFFLEPLEATAISSYIIVCRILWNFLFKSANKIQTIKEIKNYMYKIENFILWHYSTGSKYNTKFWKYSKKLYQKNKKVDFLKIVKNYNNLSYEDTRNPYLSEDYAQWPSWSFKMWNDYIHKK